MIGVIHNTDEKEAVEEFFQLFKTPWEPFQHGMDYDVVLATAGCIPEIKARLLIIFSSEIGKFDSRNGIGGRSEDRGLLFHDKEFRVPIYRRALVFGEPRSGITCLHSDKGPVGIKIVSSDGVIMRIGYDLFREVGGLLSSGQPAGNAHIPTLEIHIALLREWILRAGISFLEIPPTPGGKRFLICLTHDIDFIGIRQHKFDHTMWGFLYRSTLGAFRNLVRRRISLAKFIRILGAAASLPLVWLDWKKDFWSPFEWYLKVENSLFATYFLIPFKGRAGEQVDSPSASKRAASYELSDVVEWIRIILQRGNEVGVHGINGWHNAEQGRAELERIRSATGSSTTGNRTHWLLRQESTARLLDEAGYSYDSTDGYNETIGYRSGTVQAYRPLGTQRLLELPVHIQDGALFYPNRLDLSEEEAMARCGELIENSKAFGGVLTVIWHDRSHAPERLWGEFYRRFVDRLRTLDVWFATCGQAMDWFRKRREASFVREHSNEGSNRVAIPQAAHAISPPLTLRVHRPPTRLISGGATPGGTSTDLLWDGSATVDVGALTAGRLP